MLFKKLPMTVLSAALMAVAVFPAHAEDIDIYKVDNKAGVNSNMLLVFDTSGSMNWSVHATEADTSLTHRAVPTDKRRLEELRQATKKVLKQLSDVNVGLMRYNHSQGASVSYPVKDLEASGAEDGKVTVRSVVELGEDDGSGPATLKTGTQLSLDASGFKADEAALDGDVKVLRYRDLNLPRGAKITRAYFEVGSPLRQNDQTKFSISAEKAGDSVSLNQSVARALTSAKITWNVRDEWLALRYARSPDLSTVIQEVVNTDSWCGDKALTLVISTEQGGRAFSAYESTALDSGGYNHALGAPVLTVEYDEAQTASATTESKSCYIGYTASQIRDSKDDAEESTQGQVSLSDKVLDFHKSVDGVQENAKFGLRFQKLMVPDGAEILSAELLLASTEVIKTSNSLKVAAIKNADQPAFTNNQKALSSLETVGEVTSIIAVPVTSIPGSNQKDFIVSADVTEAVQSVVNLGEWRSGNSLGLVVSGQPKTAAADELHFHSVDADRQELLPRLVVRYRMNDKPYVVGAFTARQALLSEVNGLVADGPTPTAEALLEAYYYLAGQSVYFGKRRNNIPTGRVSHPGSYKDGTAPATGADCPGNDSNVAGCANQSITGDGAKYVTPVTEACQNSSILLLSDGAPNNNEGVPALVNAITKQDPCADAKNDGKDCSFKLAAHIANKDGVEFNPALGKQKGQVNTIGFSLNEEPAIQYMKELSQQGGGRYFDAKNSADLVKAMMASSRAKTQPVGRFAGAPTTLNTDTGTTHLDEMYLPLFQPSGNIAWAGNLKRYRYAGNDGIYDANDRKATDDDGQFVETAKSWWSTEADGAVIAKGGAASQLSNNRTVYSNLSSDVALERLNAANSNVTAEMLGVSSTEREPLLKWVEGQQAGDANNAHQQMGSLLHSNPTMVTYRTVTGSTATLERQVYVGSNDGFLHAINSRNGQESWAFVPKELLTQLNNAMKGRDASGSHQYGLDGPTSLFMIKDDNKDGVVDSGDKAYLYIGMRRGGKSYYAFDVSNRANPQLKFVIKGGTGDKTKPSTNYSKLGQSWSRLTPAKVKIGNDVKNVLIAGGGYDPDAHDNGGVAGTTEQIGSNVYMYDAETGEILWDAKSKVAQAERAGAMTTMTFSIPADITPISMNGKGITDHLYISDLGGQVFRIDLGTNANNAKGGRLAHLGSRETVEDNRRFYYPPSVAYIKRRAGNGSFLAVSLGSGYREQPKDTVTDEHLYSLRDYGIIPTPTKPAPTFDKDIALTDLIDISESQGDTKNDNGEAGADETSDVVQALDIKEGAAKKYGWYLPFNKMDDNVAGEKVLSRAIVIEGKLKFATYYPDLSAAGACGGSAGKNRSYAVDVLGGDPLGYNPVVKSGNSDFSKFTRFTELKVEGIAAGPQIVVLPYKTTNGKTNGGLCTIEADGKLVCEAEGLRMKPFKRELVTQ